MQNIDGTYTLTKTDQTQFHFNAALFCDSIKDENGSTVTVNRNAANQVTTVVDPTGRTLTLAYDASSRIHTVTDPLGRVWTLAYDASNQLTQVAFPAVGDATYSAGYGYNVAHDLTSVTDLKGNVTTRGDNWYAYCDNNPLDGIDPDGLARRKGSTEPKSWPTPPPNVVGKKPKWNKEGYWEGDNNIVWDPTGHGGGQGNQDGHWDEDTTQPGNKHGGGKRWQRDGTPIPFNPPPPPQDDSIHDDGSLDFILLSILRPISIPIRIPGGLPIRIPVPAPAH